MNRSVLLLFSSAALLSLLLPARSPAEVVAAKPSGDPWPLATCPVSGKKLTAMGEPLVLNHEGREVRLCCKGCRSRFESDPAAWLAKADAKIVADQFPHYPLKTCVISGEALGEMGEPVNLVLGNRLVRLCCNGCKKKALRDPAAVLKKLDSAVIAKQGPAYPLSRCPISGGKLGVMGKPADVVIAGRLVRLCCPGCKKKLLAAPRQYVDLVDHHTKGARAASLQRLLGPTEKASGSCCSSGKASTQGCPMTKVAAKPAPSAATGRSAAQP